MLKKIMLAAFVVAFAGGAALAQETCESKAVGKDGKPLAGAAPGWQAAFGCCENQLHEKVRKGRLIATSGNTDRKEKEPPNSRLAARSLLMGVPTAGCMGPLRRLYSSCPKAMPVDLSRK